MTEQFSRFIKTAPKAEQAILLRFAEDMQLKGLSERTIEMYVRALRQLSNHFQKSPDKVSDEELREYFLFNKNERGWSRTASTIALCGIKHFHTITLDKGWTKLKFIRPQKEKKLPVILSKREVKSILNRVQFKHHRKQSTPSGFVSVKERIYNYPTSTPTGCLSIFIAVKEIRIDTSLFQYERYRSCERFGKCTVIASGCFPRLEEGPMI